MKILIVGSFHHKNISGIQMVFKYLDYEYNQIRYNYNDLTQIIPKYDIIWFPSDPFNSSQYPSKKFIFGPHLSVFPNAKLRQIDNKYKNSIYVQPSVWACNTWIQMGSVQILPTKVYSFPVNTSKFRPGSNDRDKVFLYFKHRDPREKELLESFLKNININYTIFDYDKRYNEEHYLEYLQKSKFGIVLDAHESQGFAIEEALSCDVPLFVWCATSMRQEHGIGYPDIPATSIPYWDKRCGEFFTQPKELEERFKYFIKNLSTYKPREFIMDNLSIEPCAKNFVSLINSLNVQ